MPGFSGLQLIYYTESDYIKIDRFFVQNMENDPKKRLVVSTLVNYAHLMGSLVLAEGVETLEEYSQCKEIGCDMIQGYFVQRPTREMAELKPRHEEPVGVIRDTAFKEYMYSKFGRQLLENPSFGKDIARFITKIPIADIHSSVEKLIETYTQYNNNEGLVMVDDMKYVGVLNCCKGSWSKEPGPRVFRL